MPPAWPGPHRGQHPRHHGAASERPALHERPPRPLREPRADPRLLRDARACPAGRGLLARLLARLLAPCRRASAHGASLKTYSASARYDPAWSMPHHSPLPGLPTPALWPAASGRTTGTRRRSVRRRHGPPNSGPRPASFSIAPFPPRSPGDRTSRPSITTPMSRSSGKNRTHLVARSRRSGGGVGGDRPAGSARPCRRGNLYRGLPPDPPPLGQT